MSAQCCATGGGSRRVRGPLLKGISSILPAAVLLFLPKCPLCLAGWLTVMTGVGFSVSSVKWMRASVLVLSAASLALLIWSRVRWRASRFAPRSG
jgi:hypothetical protein